MEIKITPEHVDELVREALLKSAVGPLILRGIQDSLTARSYSTDNAVHQACKNAVEMTIAKMLREPPFAEAIQEGVRKILLERLTPESINTLAERMISSMLDVQFG